MKFQEPTEKAVRRKHNKWEAVLRRGPTMPKSLGLFTSWQAAWDAVQKAHKERVHTAKISKPERTYPKNVRTQGQKRMALAKSKRTFKGERHGNNIHSN